MEAQNSHQGHRQGLHLVINTSENENWLFNGCFIPFTFLNRTKPINATLAEQQVGQVPKHAHLPHGPAEHGPDFGQGRIWQGLQGQAEAGAGLEG